VIDIEPCQPLIGAEIKGVDLRNPLDQEAADAIRSAILKYQVIVFRDQPIAIEQHKQFARIFAKNPNSPFTLQENQAQPIADHPEILNLVADGVNKVAADVWHTDECFRRLPSVISVLRSRVVPSIGGDTVFASAVAAYKYLPNAIKDTIRNLRALNSPAYLFSGADQSQVNVIDPDKFKKNLADFPPMSQPVVRIHPETGQPAIFVNHAYTGLIEGMSVGESKELLTYLCNQVSRPEYQFRMKWTRDAVVVWDNRAVQHYAVADYSEPRHMQRLLIAGIEPAFGFPEQDRVTQLAS
jgi:alpha-ketoglutarate-dependent taurine dioxygenase